MPGDDVRLRPRIQQWLFGILYNRGAHLFDTFTDWLFLGEWTRWQETVLPLLPERGTILELGCGTGRLARGGTLPCRSWLAIDRSGAMINVARKRAKVSTLSFVQADAGHLPFARDRFDAIIATFPAPFILEPETVREIRRTLHNDGVVILLLSGELRGGDWHRRWRRRLLDLFYGAETPPALPLLPFPGFDQRTIACDTAYGRAHLVLLRPQESGSVHPVGAG